MGKDNVKATRWRKQSNSRK